MSNKGYYNFVRPTSENVNSTNANIMGCTPLTGDEAKAIYLNEIKQIKDKHPKVECDKIKEESSHHERRIKGVEISDKDLFLSVQTDDVDTLKQALDACPDNVNKLDDYGWSLLMIACQANSIESVQELLKRGVDTTVRDKAGNSAQSLIIKNKNYKLADMLLNNKANQKEIKIEHNYDSDNNLQIGSFFCDLCNIEVSNKEYHLSSTVHNLNLSKGKKLPTNYIIPESNKGYQIMLKVGWDKESGLGPDGSGKRYPIKSVQKQDRRGLGHAKRVIKVDKETETVKHKNRKTMARDYQSNRKMEIDFRRQFY